MSFLSEIGINSDYEQSKLLFDNFFDGVEEELTMSDEELLISLKNKLKSHFNWDEHIGDLSLTASQNCSDMLINIGNFLEFSHDW